MNPNKKSPKIPIIFHCENCDYFTSNKKDFRKHADTKKHKSYENPNSAYLKNPHTCHCGKIYKHASTLSAHKKKCKEDASFEEEKLVKDDNVGLFIKENTDFKYLIIEILKNNQDLQKQNQEFQEKILSNSIGTNINGNVNNINSHNKTFNMQFFLNEQCKDAMNIADFIDSFQLQLSDLERVGQLGYVDGISDIIIKKLNEMDIYKRPIHCSDTKRDIMYVRADNVWAKETNSHDRVRLLVRQVTHKNIKLLPLWTEEYPQAKDIHHSLNDTYIGMVGQAMGGRGDIEENENKIIKRIAKTVYIDKYN